MGILVFRKESAMSEGIPTEEIKNGVKRIGMFTRQPLGALGKVAFWCLLTTTIMATAGAIALSFAGGSLDLDIFAATLLVTTILVVSGLRWLQVLACLLGILLLYLYFTQPFVIESFVNPKGDPNGGFYHFVGQLVPFALICIGLAATIATVLHNYRLGSQSRPRWFSAALG